MERESTSYIHYLSYLPSVWHHFWGQIIVGAAALSLFIIYPVCRAFHSGLIAVRDPALGVPPLNTWELMDEILWRELRWWIQCWSLVFVLYCGIFLLLLLDEIKRQPLQSILMGLALPAATIGLGSLLVASCVFWAPRRVGFTSLLLTTWLTGSLACFVSLISAVLLTAPLESLSLAFWSTSIGVLIAVRFWSSAHRRGDQWFRFEQ